MADLKKFFIDMSNNAQMQQEFKSDPHALMSKAGLSHENIAAVLSKNPTVINKELAGPASGGAQAAAADITVVILIIP